MTCPVIAEVGLSWDDVNKAGPLSLCYFSLWSNIVYIPPLCWNWVNSLRKSMVSQLCSYLQYKSTYLKLVHCIHSLCIYSLYGGEISLKPYNVFKWKHHSFFLFFFHCTYKDKKPLQFLDYIPWWYRFTLKIGPGRKHSVKDDVFNNVFTVWNY